MRPRSSSSQDFVAKLVGQFAWRLLLLTCGDLLLGDRAFRTGTSRSASAEKETEVLEKSAPTHTNAGPGGMPADCKWSVAGLAQREGGGCEVAGEQVVRIHQADGSVRAAASMTAEQIQQAQGASALVLQVAEREVPKPEKQKLLRPQHVPLEAGAGEHAVPALRRASLIGHTDADVELTDQLRPFQVSSKQLQTRFVIVADGGEPCAPGAAKMMAAWAELLPILRYKDSNGHSSIAHKHKEETEAAYELFHFAVHLASADDHGPESIGQDGGNIAELALKFITIFQDVVLAMPPVDGHLCSRLRPTRLGPTSGGTETCADRTNVEVGAGRSRPGCVAATCYAWVVSSHGRVVLLHGNTIRGPGRGALVSAGVFGAKAASPTAKRPETEVLEKPTLVLEGCLAPREGGGCEVAGEQVVLIHQADGSVRAATSMSARPCPPCEGLGGLHSTAAVDGGRVFTWGKAEERGSGYPSDPFDAAHAAPSVPPVPARIDLPREACRCHGFFVPAGAARAFRPCEHPLVEVRTLHAMQENTMRM
ncbi:hypothetical protein AK812_SmicGene37907 [Symbiodinium microadriaticum]|uniref:Uncharacterized protein n=1 Tax=Symbiodinium microadriaticum TaxID=2951 RepID=A0A1Q9CF43_SYMMI|nr:hypothetical protein AK812_SmicGene37907 [Symbiodinium microadriaticum]